MGRTVYRGHLPLFLLLFGLAVIATFVAGDYGITIDDAGLWEYGDHVLLLYKEAFAGKFSFDPGPDNLRFYGPAFLSAATLAGNAIQAALPHLEKTRIWHFSIFLGFIAGLPALYYIATLLFERRIALGVTLLYLTQPLLWGHAFINGKDVPFLSFFMISVATGLFMAQQTPQAKALPKLPRLWPALQADFLSWGKPTRSKCLAAFAVLAGATVLQLAFPRWPSAPVANIILAALENPGSPIGNAFSLLAANAGSIPAQSYIEKTLSLSNSIMLFLLGIAWLLLLAWTLRALPKTQAALTAWHKAVPWAQSREILKRPAVWLAGLSLAVAWAIRVVAPFAGLLVAGILFARRGILAIPTLVIYGLIAALGAYLLWPFLWPAPVQHMLSSLDTMANFPQEHIQLFNGHIYTASSLPFYFLPQMLAIQFTLPAVLLALLGLLLFWRQRAQKQQSLAFAILLWVGLPLAYCLALTPSMYNNFRQWLFITPPLFLLAGYALSEAQKRLPRAGLYWVALGIALLPGIAGIIQLHPYQYIYYNALVGGVREAAGRFEMDYWATAFREVALELNQIAPPNSRVVVWSAALETAKHAARADLIVERNQGGTYDPHTGYHYAIIQLSPTRELSLLYPEAPVIISVSRQGTVLAAAKQLNCLCDAVHE